MSKHTFFNLIPQGTCYDLRTLLSECAGILNCEKEHAVLVSYRNHVSELLDTCVRLRDQLADARVICFIDPDIVTAGTPDEPKQEKPDHADNPRKDVW